MKQHIQVVGELLLDGGEVHGFLDDFSVTGDGFVVHRRQKGPRILMGLQLSQQQSGGANGNKTELWVQQM